jgi:hypothetical protein
MKLIDDINTIIVQRDESRAIRPLWVKVNWNCRAEDVDGARNLAPGPMQLALAAEDTDWGEADSLANIPRVAQPAWMRAVLTTEPEGDE